MSAVRIFAIGAVLALAGCSSSAPPDVEKVIEKLSQTDVGFSNAQKPERDPTSLLPGNFKDRITFTVAEVQPDGGQVFVCEKSEHCDALFNYFTAFKGIAGPYTYRSKSGLLVAQLNSKLRPETAEKLKAAVEGF